MIPRISPSLPETPWAFESRARSRTSRSLLVVQSCSAIDDSCYPLEGGGEGLARSRVHDPGVAGPAGAEGLAGHDDDARGDDPLDERGVHRREGVEGALRP